MNFDASLAIKTIAPLAVCIRLASNGSRNLAYSEILRLSHLI
jgi:hypothetical protein